MSLNIFWFLPTHGDGHYLGTAEGARAVDHGYLQQIAQAADRLGFGGVLIPIADFLQQQPDHPAAALVMQDTYHTDQAPFLPFIIERLFSTFISLHPEFGCKSYPISDIRPYCLNEEEWKIVTAMKPLVDSADEQGYFSTDLMEALNQAASSNTTQAKRYFQNNPHPHSGKLIPAHPVISS